ncbi:MULTISPECIES: 8-oxo-dGTP diphosphatase MutT [unclassified Prochlorococcus]|uniref:8-oxo-dGTP diphosphatase MutT n=1 Tax=unclassified Prochlorococcus TaxID=2627481 RepID=UPI0005338446|nr:MULTISPECIES: 8-oxo-dGTP diphosphatase MutT [unclassified Prochlorococcus]KGG14597.1 A/G-specific adenine glycosylase [Prochlorococcus sp. MIT 0602]KGG15976.1 A/G-specific adenine glycosylase [Prochlorococcus sp. MIT 0603]
MCASCIHDDDSIKDLWSIDKIEDMQAVLLNWFALHGRHWIPWKLKPNGALPEKLEKLPVYPIWIAEVMLQQTQLKVVLPYWKNWMKAFPTLVDLAHAGDHEVLLLWQGLGYYSRAKRTHQSAKKLLEIIGSNNSLNPLAWPVSISTWVDLPGIGRTTAASIISSAFDLPEALLDGNVKRILSRLIGNEQSLSRSSSKLWSLSNDLLDYDSPRNFNQALMDLGATVCLPKNPKCFCCPWKSYCCAYYQGDPSKFPMKAPKKALPNLVIGIGIVFNDFGEILIDQRKPDQTMGSMWEFPGGKQEKGELIEDTVIREIHEELGVHIKVLQNLIEFDHCYSHKKLHFVVYICKLSSGIPKPLSSLQTKWVKPDDLINYPFPAANKYMIKALQDYIVPSKEK